MGKRKASAEKKKAAKKKSVFWAAAAGVIVILCAGLAVWSGQPRLKLPYLTARSAAVMDCDTGKFLYRKEAKQQNTPASLTKLMTLLLVLDDIDAGELNWEDTFQVTAEEAETTGSKYGITPGETLTVRQLVAGTVMASGCDCVQCLVKLCAGDEAAFVRRMNEKAQELGLKNSHFANATGLDNRDHYMSAEDLARLSRTLIEEHPEILEFTSAPELEVEGKTFQSSHRLVGRDPRVLGLKTGTSQIAGCNLVTCAEEDGKRYLIVLLGSGDDHTRYSETGTILNALFEEAS